MEIEGTVSSGLGEGAYFIQIEGYNVPISEILGGEPFPGTFNITVTNTDKESFFSSLSFDTIQGFSEGEKSFGPILFARVKVENIDCIVVVPTINKHKPNVVELVSRRELRKELGKIDGQKVIIQA